MKIEEVIREIIPKVRELEKECSNLTPEEFEDTRETIINEVRKHGNQKVTVIMQSVLAVVCDNLKATVWQECEVM